MLKRQLAAPRRDNGARGRGTWGAVVFGVVGLLVVFGLVTFLVATSVLSSRSPRGRAIATEKPSSRPPQAQPNAVNPFSDVSESPSERLPLMPLLQLAASDESLDKLLGSRVMKYNKTYFTYLEPEGHNGKGRWQQREGASSSYRFGAPLPDGVCLDCYEMVSVRPRVYRFRNVFTEAEATTLIALGDPILTRSGVFSKQSIQRSVRSSFGARLPNSDPTATALNERLMFIMNHFSSDKSKREFRAGFAERLEMLRYEGSQTYYGHLDNFGGIDGPIARDRAKKVRAYEATLAKIVELTTYKRDADDLASTRAPQKNTDVRGGGIPLDVEDTNAPPSLTETLCASLWKQYAPIKEPLLDRGATMIAFLHTMNGSSTPGGHTTFPFAVATSELPVIPLKAEIGGRASLNWTDDLAASPNARRRWKTMLTSFRTAKDSACKPRRPSQAANDSTNLPPPFLAIRPTVGDVVVFYDTYPNGVSDPFALHAGCPPISEDALTAAVEEELQLEIHRNRTHNDASVNDSAAAIDARRLELRQMVAKRHIKVIATKWFMFPVIAGVAKPPAALCPRRKKSE